MSEPAETPATRAGHVALVGRPNVGKSTLLNALVGEKLSIVTPKAQTTRESVTGILTTERAQAIFVDTPGLLEPKYALQRAMQGTALEVLKDADLVLLLLDATRARGGAVRRSARRAASQRTSSIIVLINKIDVADEGDVEALAGVVASGARASSRVAVSAVTGAGIDALRSQIEERLPANPFYYPADELATQPVRFFVAELIRETIFELYEQEVPVRDDRSGRGVPGERAAGTYPRDGVRGAGEPEADPDRTRRHRHPGSGQSVPREDRGVSGRACLSRPVGEDAAQLAGEDGHAPLSGVPPADEYGAGRGDGNER
jgi:GTPase